jgi:hypothetical protein
VAFVERTLACQHDTIDDEDKEGQLDEVVLGRAFFKEQQKVGANIINVMLGESVNEPRCTDRCRC